jgi:hypothetical protein
MKSTDNKKRAYRNQILRAFCITRGMMWEPVNDWEPIDATLWNKRDKRIGVAKVFNDLGKYGSKPVIHVAKPSIDFLQEFSLLTGLKVAVVIKFKDTAKYFRLNDPKNFKPVEVIKRGKTYSVYELPVSLLGDIVSRSDSTRQTS